MSEWRKIKGIEARVNPFGEVRLKSAVIEGYEVKDVPKRPHTGENGRLFHTFKVDGKLRKICLHILVARAFIKNPKHYKYVKHKDGDLTNNTVENLEWVESPPRYGARAKVPGAKLNKRNVTAIKNRINKGHTLASIADYYEVSVSLISRIKSGERWN